MLTMSIFVFAAGILYPVLHSVILRLTEGVRLELADVGRVLLQDPQISDEHKTTISDMLDDVFDWKFLAFATIAFPRAVISRSRGTGLSESDIRFLEKEEVCRFYDLHIRATLAASPIFAIIFMIVALVTVTCVILFFGFSAISTYWADAVKNVTPYVGIRYVDHNHTDQ